jgi:hypothetical protein
MEIDWSLGVDPLVWAAEVVAFTVVGWAMGEGEGDVALGLSGGVGYGLHEEGGLSNVGEGLTFGKD